MEDAFTGSLVLALLAVAAFAYATLRPVRQDGRALAGPRGADGGWACVDGRGNALSEACIEAERARARAEAVVLRAKGCRVERWLVRAARRAPAAPPGDAPDPRAVLALRADRLFIASSARFTSFAGAF